MGKYLLTMQMSLDGVVSDLERWMTLSDDMLEDMLVSYDTVEAVLVGARTYAPLAEYWQEAEKSSDSSLERKLAKKLNDLRKIVVTRSELELVWRRSEQVVVRDSDAFVREMNRLREEIRGTISVESGLGTWRSFVRHSLFDDLWVFVHPAIAGQGDKLFGDAEPAALLRLEGSRTYSNGAVGLSYRRS